MRTHKEFKKEMLKDPLVRFWYIVYWPKYFLIGLWLTIKMALKNE